MDRRRFIKSTGFVLPIAGILPKSALEIINSNGRVTQLNETIGQNDNADYTIRICTGLIEVGPQHIISTTTYNGQFPGPLLQFKEGRQAVVDIYNDTDTPEQFHWHGQFLPTDIDGFSIT